MKDPWELPYGGRATQEDLRRHACGARSNVITQASNPWFVDDLDNPYIEIQRFDWIRGYHVGGRSIMWGRQSYRWSPMDFEANAREGIAVDWPIRYHDLAPWYDHVEGFIGEATPMASRAFPSKSIRRRRKLCPPHMMAGLGEHTP